MLIQPRMYIQCEKFKNDFILYIFQCGMDPSLTVKWVNPPEKWVKDLLIHFRIEPNGYVAKELWYLWLYLSNLESRNRGYREWFTDKMNQRKWAFIIDRERRRWAYESNS